MATMIKSISKSNAKRNKVSVEKLLSSIHLLHEVCYDEWGIQDHPYINLHADGSGIVMATRAKIFGKKNPIMKFITLKDFVTQADELSKKHKVEWAD